MDMTNENIITGDCAKLNARSRSCSLKRKAAGLFARMALMLMLFAPCATCAACVASPCMAYASSTGSGTSDDSTSTDDIVQPMNQVVSIIKAIAIVVGVAFLFFGSFQFASGVQSHDRGGMQSGVMGWVAAAVLIASPLIVTFVQQSS